MAQRLIEICGSKTAAIAWACGLAETVDHKKYEAYYRNVAFIIAADGVNRRARRKHLKRGGRRKPAIPVVTMAAIPQELQEVAIETANP